MKKYVTYSIILLFSILLSGCKIDVDDDEKLPGDRFWIEGGAANAEAYCLSIYNSLRDAAIQKSGFFYVAGDLRCAPVTDLKQNAWNDYVNRNEMAKARDSKDSQQKGESWEFGAIYNWKNFYRVIQGANIMIKEIDNVKDLDNNEKQAYKAEGVFLRNLAYFYLVRLFGDVPYYTEAYYSKPLSRTPMVSVLQNCLRDMQALLDSDPNAVILPWYNNNKRANRAGMLTLMMHINMWLVQFDSARKEIYYGNVKELAEIESWIDRKDMFDLLPISRTSDIFRGGTNETFFEIVQNVTSGEVFPTSNMWSTYVVYECLNKIAPDWRYNTLFLKELYPANETDQRKTLWFRNMEYDETGSIITSKVVNSGSSSSTELVYIEITKFLNIDESSSKVIPNSGNYIVFRLADAILLYAEALNALGDSDKALEEVNRVRERAGASLYTETTNLDEGIYWERVRELMGEGQYFYDLVRTGKLCDMDFAVFGESGHREKRADFNQGSWTWPIFKGAIENNPYISKNQYWE